MNPLTVLALLQEPRFLTGAGIGVVGAVMLVATGRRSGWFLVWAAAAIVSLVVTGIPAWPPEARSWMLAVAMLTFLTVSVGSIAIKRTTEGWVAPVLFALAVLGVWGTVPDTEHARVLMGVSAALLVVALGPGELKWSLPGLALATGVLAYVVVVDGWPRDSAIIGACGSVGMLVVAPVVLALRRSPRRPFPSHEPWTLVAAQIVLVILSGRVAGRAESAGVAAGLLVVSYLAVGLVWARFVSTSGSGGGMGGGRPNPRSTRVLFAPPSHSSRRR